MDKTLTDFLKALRGADVRVSVAETLDAVRTADLVGYGDREMLKTSLSFTLAKTPEEKLRFSECFDQFFAFDSFQGGDGEGPVDSETAGEVAEIPLARMMLEQDRSQLAVAMQEAASKVDVMRIRFFTQKGLYTQRILEQMGLRDVDAAVAGMTRAGNPAASGVVNALKSGRAYLMEQVRDYVEQQLLLHGADTIRSLREDRLKTVKLSNLERRDLEHMRRIVDKMARRLVALHSRQRKVAVRGQLDIRKTMRKNRSNDGILFDLHWKRRKIDRPRVYAICDVSGSVAAVARFLLLFLHSLHDVVEDIKSFAFSAYLAETSEYFETLPAEAAISRVIDDIGMRPTDYGRMLDDFKKDWLDRVDNRTTVIILGDGRSNYTDPRADIMALLYQRAKKVIWLNPEPKQLWGTGDSEMPRYVPHCHVARVCNTVQQLERVVADMLKGSARG